MAHAYRHHFLTLYLNTSGENESEYNKQHRPYTSFEHKGKPLFCFNIEVVTPSTIIRSMHCLTNK